MQRIGHLVEAGLRRIALLGQCMSAIIGLLRQHESRLRPLKLRLPRGNSFHPCSDENIGKLRLGNNLCRSHLLVFGESFGIVDPHEDSRRRNVLATFDRYFLDPPVDTRGAANPVASVDAAQRPALLPMPPQTVSPSVAPQRPLAGEDSPVIAAKMKIGVELMTYGEVAAARVMFQRAAEAGDGAGAFALAETYDPLVLGGLRLREGITPDLALARTWYERARDLGSLEARDRISRLAQLPQ